MTIRLGKLNIAVLAIVPVAVLCFFNPPEYVGAMLFCALLHELGHLTAIKAVGEEVLQIDITPLGAKIRTGGRLCSYTSDAAVHCAGAVANLLGSVCGYFCYLTFESTEFIFIIFANIFYAFFNMLPIRGLDGGNFLESLLLKKYDPDAVWGICEKISLVFIIVLFFVSLWVIFASKNNLSLLFVVIYLFVNL